MSCITSWTKPFSTPIWSTCSTLLGDSRNVSPDESTSDIELRLDKKESSLEDLRAQLATAEAELNRIHDMPRILNQEIALARVDLDEIDQASIDMPDSSEPAVVVEARRVLLESRRKARLARAAHRAASSK